MKYIVTQRPKPLRSVSFNELKKKKEDRNAYIKQETAG